MKGRTAKKIVRKIAVGTGKYNKHQAHKALVILTRNWTVVDRYYFLDDIISASCGDTYPWRFDEYFVPYDIAYRLSITYR